ncbi:MAG: hypothetical protein RhofKO_16120 [Rhodothermales bacterium]
MSDTLDRLEKAAASAGVSRRTFVRKASASAVLLALGLNLSACDSSDPGTDEPEPTPGGDSGISVSGDTITLDLTKSDAAQVGNAGGFLITGGSIIINLDGDTIRAFTSRCTHTGCAVNDFRNNEILCPCHGSKFSTSGAVVAGPAPSPLDEYTVNRSGDTVTVRKV